MTRREANKKIDAIDDNDYEIIYANFQRKVTVIDRIGYMIVIAVILYLACSLAQS